MESTVSLGGTIKNLIVRAFMIYRAGIFTVVVCLVLGGGRELSAGSIHLRYPVNAPERLAGANERYTREVLSLDRRHPEWFEHTHPFYAHMFTNPEMMDRLIARWEAHEQRFEYWHNSLWKILDAYAIGLEHSLPLLPIDLPASRSAVSDDPGAGPGGVGPGGGTYGNVGGASVPEPSNGILMVSGLIVGLLGLAWRRILRRFSTDKRVPG